MDLSSNNLRYDERVRSMVLKFLLFTLVLVTLIAGALVYQSKLPPEVFLQVLIPGLLGLLAIAVKALFR